MDDATGRAIDLATLDRIVIERVVRRFDHQDLNRDPAFAAMTTTGENLARLIWEILRDAISGGQLAKVGVVETRDNYFEYAGASSPG
jgi:6-pyruvoyltetrahydropterin/6-carboxytetrahydropterin synthase